MQWFGTKVEFNRFLGQVDSDDPTNLPVGLASVCRNTEFTRDTGGSTCAQTRAGLNLSMQGANNAPITGLEEFVYQPELSTDVSFERPMAFDYAGQLYYENPVGTGRLVPFPAGGLTPPESAHMIDAVTGNKLYAAFSNLKTPIGNAACIDPKAFTIWPLGMKPFGWQWQPSTPVIAGEVCCPPTPATGNGHTYQAQNSGITGVNTPAFPTAEGATFVDGFVTWKELTMVVANRLPAPPAPTLAVVPAGGTWAAGLDVYIVITLVNAMGESLAGVAAKITNTAANIGINVTVPTLASLAGWIQSLGTQYVPTACFLYVASVATGSAAPPQSEYFGPGTSVALGGSLIVTAQPASSQPNPPTVNSARITPGQLPTPDVEPQIDIDPGAGTFPAGRDVYVLQTYKNTTGETTAGPASSVINTNLNDGVQVTVAEPEDDNGNPLFTISQIGIYEADVPTGTPAPPASAFRLVGYYAVGATPVITATAAGASPPTTNTTGPGGSIQADTADGGINATQGYRYAACMFMNQNETVSGFTAASVVKYDVDQDGWELATFNIAIGPANIAGRPIAFTSADGTPDGPFDWIGEVDLLVPTQNFVYPMTEMSGADAMTSTMLLDNTTTQAVFNFTDSFLESENDVTDRLQVIAPPQCMRVDYLESANCLALSGVNGYNGGGVFSISTDYESFRGDLGPVPISANGEVCFGFTDRFKGIIFAVRSASGYAITPNTGSPSSFKATRRWGGEGPGQGVGACGFRAWAACSKFIMFVHRTGIYKYDEGDDDLMSKEVPREWSTVNWAAAETIECYIDEDTKQVLVSVPIGNSTVPNKVIALSYIEGWQNPIHFSTFSGKEISMDAARRYSFQDIQAFVIKRVKRTLPPGPAFVDGPDWTTMPDPSFAVTQLLFGSSGPDGGVSARTPGIYNDNGAGIDWRYRTVSAGAMQAVCKPEGFNLNAVGQGNISATFWAARDMSDGQGGKSKGIKARDIALAPDQKLGITRKVPTKMNEYWSVEFSNNKQPDMWCSLKTMTVYVIPVTAGRGELDRGFILSEALLWLLWGLCWGTTMLCWLKLLGVL